MRVIVIIFTLLLAIIISSQAQVGQVHKAHVDSSIIEQHKMILAMEFCPENKYSFCRDNGVQWYRLPYPHFVLLSSDCLDSNYSDIFILQDSKRIKSYNDIEEINNLQNKLKGLISPNNLIYIYDKKFKGKVSKLIKGSGGRNDFDGKLYYALFEIEFKCTFSGIQQYLIPDICYRHKGIAKSVKSNEYYITDLVSVKPINGKDYISSMKLKKYN